MKKKTCESERPDFRKFANLQQFLSVPFGSFKKVSSFTGTCSDRTSEAISRPHRPRPNAWAVGFGKTPVPLELHEREGHGDTRGLVGNAMIYLGLTFEVLDAAEPGDFKKC